MKVDLTFFFGKAKCCKVIQEPNAATAQPALCFMRQLHNVATEILLVNFFGEHGLLRLSKFGPHLRRFLYSK